MGRETIGYEPGSEQSQHEEAVIRSQELENQEQARSQELLDAVDRLRTNPARGGQAAAQNAFDSRMRQGAQEFNQPRATTAVPEELPNRTRQVEIPRPLWVKTEAVAENQSEPSREDKIAFLKEKSGGDEE
ncbi:MAG TPA: hypothetical protein VEC17_00235, partial [Candidatus Binatia bacterium]|nr:hypothetical protein [Candidatus Binatia bacterium]